MAKTDYLDKVSKWFKFIMNILNPYDLKKHERKYSFKAKFSMCLHISMEIAILSYIYKRYCDDELTFLELTEMAAVFLCIVRNILYLVLINLWNDKMKSMVDRIISDRNSTRGSPENWSNSLEYCRIEFLSISALIFNGSITVALFVTSVLFMKINDTNLPFKLYLVFLPLDGTFLKWFINYLYQALFELNAVYYLFSYFPATLILMNHSCWGLDDLVVDIKKFQLAEGKYDYSELKKIVEKSNRVMEYQQSVQDILQFSFFLEFTSLSFILCLLFCSLTTEPSALVIFFVPIYCVQLFVYCWMGDRVNERIGTFAAAIYDLPWYTMRTDHRKDCSIVLTMAQNINGFNGIFNDVSMRTFLKIVQFTYSLLTLLQSTN